MLTQSLDIITFSRIPNIMRELYIDKELNFGPIHRAIKTQKQIHSYFAVKHMIQVL